MSENRVPTEQGGDGIVGKPGAWERSKSSLQLRSKVAESLFGAQAVPTHVGDLVVLRELAAGGFERAFLAYDVAREQKVELLLCPASIDKEKVTARAAAAARALGLRTKVICEQERNYIALSFPPRGKELPTTAAPTQASSELLAFWIGAGEILCRAHLAGILHGDFSTRSMRISRDGRVFLIGFRHFFAPIRNNELPPEAQDAPTTAGAKEKTQLVAEKGSSDDSGSDLRPAFNSASDCFDYCSAMWRFFGGQLSVPQPTQGQGTKRVGFECGKAPALSPRIQRLLGAALSAPAKTDKNLLPCIVAELRRERTLARIRLLFVRFAVLLAITVLFVLARRISASESDCDRLVRPWTLAQEATLKQSSIAGSVFFESAGLLKELRSYISKGKNLHHRACVYGESLPISAPADLDAVSACYLAAANSVVSYREQVVQARQKGSHRLVLPTLALTPLESCLHRNIDVDADLPEFEKVEEMLAQSRLHAAFYDFRASLALANKALEHLSEERHRSRIIRALLLQARAQNALGDTLDARHSVDLAYYYAQGQYNESLRLRAAVLRSKIMLRQGKFSASAAALRDAWPLVQKDSVSVEAKFEFLSKACLVDRRDMNSCDSIQYCRRAIDLVEREGLSDLHLSEIERRMAWIAYEAGHVEEAIELATRAQKRVGEYAGEKSVYSLESDALLLSLNAELLRESGSAKSAFESLQQEGEGIYERYFSAFGAKNYLVAIARTNLAEISRRAGKLRRAKELYEEQLELSPDDAERYFAVVGYGKTLIELGEKKRGVDQLLEALSQIESIEKESRLAGGNPRIPERAEALLALSKALGSSPEGLDCARRARALYFELNQDRNRQATNCEQLANGSPRYAREYESADRWIMALLRSEVQGD